MNFIKIGKNDEKFDKTWKFWKMLESEKNFQIWFKFL